MIKVNDLCKVYENGVVALDNISFELPQTGFVAIVGKSGSGKSTLINLLSGSDIASNGTIEYEDKSFAQIEEKEKIKQFGYIYQDYKLIDNLTVYQNIMIGHELASESLNYDMVIKIATLLDIDDILDEKIYSLSGGQQQRVAIARTLVRNPKVIFADEPTGNLDTYNSINVFNILRTYAKEKLVVVVSHDKEISKWADATLTLIDGKLVEYTENDNADFVKLPEPQAVEVEKGRVLNDKKAKKTSKFFSYKNAPKKSGKKAGLRAKTSFGLSLALLNKDIAKKICLIIVMVIMIAFLELSCAMTFATVEKTMAKAINANSGQKIFTVSPTIDNPTYIISYEDMKNFDKFIEESGLTYYEIAEDEIIADGWQNLRPVDGDKNTAYFERLSFAQMSAIFTDNPEKAGIELIIGNTPKFNNEIAISKTFYDYLLHCKQLKYNIDNNEYMIELNKNNIIGTKIEPLGIVISGVFDDNNSLDESFKTLDVYSISSSEREEILNQINEEFQTNSLVHLVIKCENAKSDYKQFSAVNSYNKITLENCFGTTNSEFYFDFAPLNTATLSYYHIDETSTLGKNQIMLDKTTLDKINKFLGSNFSNPIEVAEGDSIPMSVVKMATMGGYNYYPEYIYATEQIIISKVVEKLGSANGVIFMSEDTFNSFNIEQKYTTKRLISEEQISSSSLKMLNKKFVKYAENLEGGATNNYVTYSIHNCPMTKANNYGIIYICQQYICLPLMIFSFVITIAIILVFYFDFIKTKSKDLLILKSQGATSLDFVKIYGVFCLTLIAALLVFGLSLGSLLIWLVNIFASTMSGYVSTFAIFYLDWVAVITAISLVLLINLIAFAISFVGLSNKNLRKAFQKIKK